MAMALSRTQIETIRKCLNDLLALSDGDRMPCGKSVCWELGCWTCNQYEPTPARTKAYWWCIGRVPEFNVSIGAGINDVLPDGFMAPRVRLFVEFLLDKLRIEL